MAKHILGLEELAQDKLRDINLNDAFRSRSEIAHEVINLKPDFFEKWALLLFLIFLLLLVAGSWFVKYPDIVYGSATLTGNNAPKEIIPRQTGKLAALFVKNNQLVKQGEILGWIESNADIKSVIELSKTLDSSIKIFDGGKPDLISGLFVKRFLNLGELQVGYQTFFSALQQYNDYLVNGYFYKRRQLLRNDISSFHMMEENVKQQKEFLAEESDLAKKTFQMNEQLFKEKVISAEEYRQAQGILLSKLKANPQMEMTILSQQNQIRDKQKEIDQLNHDILRGPSI